MTDHPASDDDVVEEPTAEEAVLLATLATVLEAADPVPDEVRAAAVGAFAWRTIDDDLAQLAELAYDSAAEPAAAGTRAGAAAATTDTPGVRELTFRAAGTELEVLIDEGAGRIDGQLVGIAATSIRLEGPVDGVDAAVDALGRFRVDRVPGGPVRFRLDAGGRRWRTDWVRLAS